jgi:hypothetical protein
MMDALEDEDICSRVKFRFSVTRFQNAVKDLSKKQRDILVKYGFDRLLELQHHTIYPTSLIMWIMDNMIAELAIFQFGSKRINFDKNMIQQFIGIPAGTILLFAFFFVLLSVSCFLLLQFQYHAIFLIYVFL